MLRRRMTGMNVVLSLRIGKCFAKVLSIVVEKRLSAKAWKQHSSHTALLNTYVRIIYPKQAI